MQWVVSDEVHCNIRNGSEISFHCTGSLLGAVTDPHPTGEEEEVISDSMVHDRTPGKRATGHVIENVPCSL